MAHAYAAGVATLGAPCTWALGNAGPRVMRRCSWGSLVSEHLLHNGALWAAVAAYVAIAVATAWTAASATLMRMAVSGLLLASCVACLCQIVLFSSLLLKPGMGSGVQVVLPVVQGQTVLMVHYWWWRGCCCCCCCCRRRRRRQGSLCFAYCVLGTVAVLTFSLAHICNECSTPQWCSQVA